MINARFASVQSTLFLILIPFIINSLFYKSNEQLQVQPKFVVSTLPARTKYNKANLNQEISVLTSKEAIRKFFVHDKKFSITNFVVRIEEPKGNFRWWYLDDNPKREREGDKTIVSQSKALEKAEVNSVSDFRIFFKDTLVLLDSLALDLYLQDKNYPNNQFAISFSCDQRNIQQNLIQDKAKLWVTPSLFSTCSSIGKTRFFNRANPTRELAIVQLSFLTPEQKEMLCDVAYSYREAYPASNLKEITAYTASFCAMVLGRTYYPQLMKLLASKLK
jgi:hypothetical protein